MSITRISGLASGMDTDSMVKSMLQPEQMKLDKLAQNKQVLQWQQADYRSMNNTLRTLRDSAFNMKLQGTYLNKTADSSSADLTASVGTSAVKGTYQVTVTQLATGVNKGSTLSLTDEANTNGTTKTLKDQFALTADTLTFTLEGSKGSEDFSFDTNSDNIYTLVSKINSAGIGISASYDATLNRFFLNSASTGSDAQILVSNDDSNFLSNADGATGANQLGLKLQSDVAVTGQNAKVDFGDATGLEFASNTFTVNGITMTAKSEVTAANITVTNDTDATVKKITDFINLYNTTIDTVNKKISEERYKDYLPLTDDQRTAMSEDQQTKWEDKAKSGLLKNDDILSNSMSSLRSAIYSPVTTVSNSEYNTLASVGITTNSWEEKGKLYIDTTKLTAALNDDPQAVMDLFTKSGDDYTTDQNGIATRLYDSLKASMSTLSDKAGVDDSFSSYDDSTIGKQIEEITDKVTSETSRSKDLEERYYKQFTAMEVALSKLNTQSSWLAQQFGTGSS